VTKEYNVVVDIGNTRIKIAVFENGAILKQFILDQLNELEEIFEKYKGSFVISSVKNDRNTLDKLLQDQSYLYLDHTTPLPIRIDYLTPQTLGMDRLAAIVGGFSQFEKNVLVIDIGTCVTYDYLDHQSVYQGGAISPGLQMRMRAMSHYTSQLPDISQHWENIPLEELGKSTQGCLRVGAFKGLLKEIEGFISDYRKDNDELHVILTGGDSKYFESKLKAPIFADFNLLLTGLNTILNFNK
jgi:type III pantothenate kinase